jgi:hypothetical protein
MKAFWECNTQYRPEYTDIPGLKLEFLARIHFSRTAFREEGEYLVPPFFIVGDDVVILQPSLAGLYEEEMRSLDVPISHDKSIKSKGVAEFVGHLITDTQLYLPTKWRQVSMESFIDFLKTWGYSAVSLLPRHLRGVASVIVELPEPLGCGFNPHGKSICERLMGFEELYLNPDKCPVLLPVQELGDASTILSIYERMKGQQGSIILDIPIYSPSTFIKSVSHNTRPGYGVLFDALEPSFRVELKLLFKFARWLTPYDLQGFLNDALDRYRGTKPSVLDVARAFGFIVPKPAESSQNLTFGKVLDAILVNMLKDR